MQVTGCIAAWCQCQIWLLKQKPSAKVIYSIRALIVGLVCCIPVTDFCKRINLKYDFLLNLTLSGHFMNVAVKVSIFSLALNVPRESRCAPDSFLQKDIEVKNELMESDSSHAMTLWSLNTAVYTPTPRANGFYWPLCFLFPSKTRLKTDLSDE